MVKRVEHLQPEAEAVLFFEYRETFRETGVDRIGARPDQNVAAGIAEARFARGGIERRHGREGRRIEPRRWITPAHGKIRLHAVDNVRPIVRQTAGRGESWGHHLAGGEGPDAG